MDKIRELILRKLSGRIFATFIAVGLVCAYLFRLRDAWFNDGRAPSDHLKSLDFFRPEFRPDEILAFLNLLYSQQKLVFYGVSELMLDLIFPVVYVGFFLFIIVRTFGAAPAKFLIVFPLAAGVFDLFENSLIAYISFTFDGTLPGLAKPVFYFNFLKWSAAGLSASISVVGMISLLIRKIRAR